MALFFKNFIVVVILIGLLTRIGNYLYRKIVKIEVAVLLSALTVGIIILPIVSLTIGFDVAISEYMLALIIWLIFDLLKKGISFNPRRKK